jgi:hypothetical protein
MPGNFSSCSSERNITGPLKLWEVKKVKRLDVKSSVAVLQKKEAGK